MCIMAKGREIVVILVRHSMVQMLMIFFCIQLLSCLHSGLTAVNGEISRIEEHRFGSVSSRKNVDIFRGFPNAESFFNDYVTPSSPVLLKKASLALLQVFSDDVILSSPFSLTTFVNVRGKHHEAINSLSVRQFLRRYQKDALYLDIPIPTLLKYQIPLPRSLQCQAAVDVLEGTRLLYRYGEWHDPVQSNENNLITCKVGGTADVHMINYATFTKRHEIMDLENGKKSSINVLNVDYEKFPAMKEVPEYYVTSLEAGDCLFIPAKWLYQISSEGKSISLSLSWNRTIIVPSEKICANVTDLNLAMVHFKKDPEPDVLSLIQHGALHHIIEDFVLSGETFTYEKFQQKLQKNDLLKDLAKWNEECEEVCQELFEDFDLNKDGVFSIEDFESATSEDIEDISGHVEDHLADFGDIIEDQMAEKKMGSLLNIPEGLSLNYEKELQNILKEGFKDILKDANVQGEIDFDKDGAPIVKIQDKEQSKDDGKITSEIESVKDTPDAEEIVEQIFAEDLGKDEL